MWGPKKWTPKLQEELGCEKRQPEGEQYYALYGQRDGFDFQVNCVDEGPVALLLFTNEGEDSLSLRQRILKHPSLSDFMSQHGLGQEQFFCEPTMVRCFGPESWYTKKPPSVKDFAAFLGTLGEIAAEKASPYDRLCWICNEQESPLMFIEGSAQRRCSACQSTVEDIFAQTLEAERPSGSVEPALMLDSKLSPREMLKESQRLTREFDDNPQRYWYKLLAWVGLGQLALAGGLAILILLATAAIGGLVWAFTTGKAVAIWILAKVLLSKGFKLIILIFVAAIGLFGSIASWFRRPSNDVLEGAVLERSEAPKMFAWMDDISEQLGAPKVDLLVIDTAVNASASEKRLGRGEYRKVVSIGVPLLEICSTEEMKSIVAHELAHLCHDDPKSRFIYRTMQSWNRVAATACGETGFGSFERFSNWFIPRFLVRAQVLIRAAEHGADAAARAIVSREIQAKELVKIHICGRLFWECYFKASRLEVERSSERDFMEFTMEKLRELPSAKIETTYREALDEKPHWLHSHPTLSQQFEILELAPPAEPEWDLNPEPLATSLIDHYPSVRKRAVATTQKNVELDLLEHRFRRQGELRRLTLLEAQYAENPTPEMGFALARFLNRVDRDEEAIELLEKVIAERPEHSDALFELVGLLNYRDNEEQAGDLLEKYFHPDENSDPGYLYAALNSFESCGRKEAAARCARLLMSPDLSQDVKEALEETIAKGQVR